ncbi:MAG TPA: hypothetical protein VK324_08200, partial [Tepidisphaeraceae bacterium]|nr:hypothetical protein [Tepidisphaeraceae bacterium]
MVTPVEVVEAEPQAEIVDGADIDVVAELPSQPELADADRIEPLELELADTLPAAEVEAPAEAKFKFDLDDLIEPPAPTAPALPKLVEPVPEPEPVELDETKLLQPAAEDGVDEAPEPIELPELELAEPEPEAEVEPTVEVGPAAEAELEVEPESEPHSELEPEPAAAALTAPAESDLLDFPADEVEPDAEPEAEPVAMDAEPEPAPAPVAPPPPAARRSGTMAYEAPDESDMLVPADDDDGASVGRDQQSFLGGMPLPLPQAPGLPDDGRDGPMSPAATTAAPRPAALPPPAAPPRSKVPPRPPAQRSYTPFAGTPFEVSADELPIPENQQPYVPPFAGGGKAGRKAMGFDGLAMPPVRQVDVFSQATGPAPTIPRAGQPTPPPVEPEPAGDVIDEDDAPDFGDGDAPIAPALTNLGNRAAPPKPPVAGFRPPAPAPADPNRPPVKKRRRFGVRWLLPVVLLGMLGTGAGIWLFVSPQTQVEGRIVYDGLPELMRNDPAKAKRLQAEQAALALDAGTLSRATASLQRDFRVKAPGFLGNAVDLEKNVRVEWWPRDKPVRMVLHRTSTSPNDRERMRAWVEAIVAATGTLKDGKARLEAERDATERARRDAQERVSFLQGRIQQATGAFEAAPSRDERQRLAGAVETAKATVGDAQRELTVARDAL